MQEVRKFDFDSNTFEFKVMLSSLEPGLRSPDNGRVYNSPIYKLLSTPLNVRLPEDGSRVNQGIDNYGNIECFLVDLLI